MLRQDTRIRGLSQNSDIFLADAMCCCDDCGNPIGFIRAQFGECHAQLR
jgi:hypothetical protein